MTDTATRFTFMFIVQIMSVHRYRLQTSHILFQIMISGIVNMNVYVGMGFADIARSSTKGIPGSTDS